MSDERRIALITGASSGIGEATVRALADAGFDTISASRRLDRLEALADEVGGRALRLDVADPDSVAALAAEVEAVDVIVHSAGGALGLEPIAAADEDDWRQMWESNVAGVMRVTKALLPALRRGRDRAHRDRRLGRRHRGLRGRRRLHRRQVAAPRARADAAPGAAGGRVRVTEVAPGMVETEFSLVRFEGDAERAADVYEGLTPLTAADVAEAIAFCVSRPPHVDVDYLAIKPTQQATAKIAHRRD